MPDNNQKGLEVRLTSDNGHLQESFTDFIADICDDNWELRLKFLSMPALFERLILLRITRATKPYEMAKNIALLAVRSAPDAATRAQALADYRVCDGPDSLERQVVAGDILGLFPVTSTV